MKREHCNQCKYDWDTRLPKEKKPKTCPNCKRYDWEKPKVTKKRKKKGKKKGGESVEI